MVLIINHKQGVNLYNYQHLVVLKDICEIKTLADTEYTVLLLDTHINEDGVIEELKCFFEEIVISLKVVAVITNKKNPKLQEICEFHQISLVEIE
jgi:hypothetical protein